MQRQLSSFAILLMAVFASIFVGCGGGGGTLSSAGNNNGVTPGTPQIPFPSARILLRHELLARAIPTYIQQVRCTGLTDDGRVRYGPVTFGKTAEIVLSEVPLEVGTLRIEYLQGGAVRGLGLVSVVLVSGETYLVVDPPFQDVNAVVTGLKIEPPNISLPAGQQLPLSVQGTFNTGEIQDVTDLVRWTVGDPTLAELEGQVLRALAPGSTTLTANLGSVEHSVNVTVTPAVLQSLSLSAQDLSLPKGLSERVTVDGFFSDGSRMPLTEGLQWSSDEPNVAEVDITGNITAKEVGQTTIRVRVEDGPSASLSITVTEATLTHLRLSKGDQSLPKGASVTIQALGTFTDNLERDVSDQVLWSSDDTAVAAVTNGVTPALVSARAIGATTIRCQMDALAASLSVEVTPAQLSGIEVVPGSDTLAAGLSINLIAYARYTDNTLIEIPDVSWSSDNEELAVVSSWGRATALKAGETEIKATKNGLTGSFSLLVSDVILEELTLSETQVSLPQGLTTNLTVSGRFSDHSVRDMTDQVFWTTWDPNTASVSAEGLVRAHKQGQTRLKVTSPLGVSDQIDVGVSEAKLEDLRILSPTSPAPQDLELQFLAEGSFSDGSVRDLTYHVSWGRDNFSVGAFNFQKPGFFLTDGPGSTNITASFRANGYHVDESVPFEVASISLERIELNPGDLELPTSMERQFTATGHYENGTTYNLTQSVSWAWVGTGPMTVINSGSRKGLLRNTSAAGTGTVQASHADGTVGSSAVNVVVGATVTSVKVLPESVIMPKGTALRFTGEALFSNGYLAPIGDSGGWNSSNRSVASPSSDGGTTASGIGTTTITLTFRGVSGTAQLEVTDAALKSIRIVPTSLKLPTGLRYRLVCLGSFSDGSERDVTDQVRWGSDDPRVAAVSNEPGRIGEMSTRESGTTFITAVHEGSQAESKLALLVEKKHLVSIALDSGPTYLRLDTDRSFKAEGHYSDGSVYELTQAVDWSISDSAVAEIGDSAFEKGRLRGLSAGKATVSMRDPVSGLTGEQEVELATTTRLARTNALEDAYLLQRSPNGERIYLHSRSGLQTWSADNLSLINELILSQPGTMDVSPDGDFVMFGDIQAGRVTKVDQDSFQSTQIAIPGATYAQAVAVADNGYAYVNTDIGLVAIELATSTVTPTNAYASRSVLMRYDSVYGKLVVGATGVSPSRVYRFDADGPNLTLEAQQESGGNGQSLKIHPRGGRFVFCVGAGNELNRTLGYAYVIFLFDLFELDKYISIMDPGIYPRDAAFSPDGSILYAINGSFYDQRVYVFCTESGRVLGHIYPEQDGLDADLDRIELSKDGAILYLYGSDSDSVLESYRVR